MDILHRRAARSRRRSARRRRHALHPHAVSEQSLLDQPARSDDQLDLRTDTGHRHDSGDVLRHREPRARVRRRQDLSPAGRHQARRAQRRDRCSGVDGDQRRPREGRDQHQRAAGRQRQSDHGHQRRRVRRTRLRRRIRHRYRPPSLESLQRWAGSGHVGRSPAHDAPRAADRRELELEHLGRRAVEARRRHDLGLVHLRPRAQSRVLRHRQSGYLESHRAPRRQPLEHGLVRTRRGHGYGEMGVSDDTARRVGLRRRQRERARRSRGRWTDAQGSRALRSQRLRLYAGSRERRVARRGKIRSRGQLGDARRHAYGPPAGRGPLQHGQEWRRLQHRGHLPGGARLEGSTAGGVLAAHEAVLCSDQPCLHGL